MHILNMSRSLLYTLRTFKNSHNTIKPGGTKLFYNLDSAVWWIIFLIGERDKGVKREESAVVY